MALPVEIAVEASNGASDYGNKFGEPVLAGFARSFGMMLPNRQRREWVKPIMFSGGIGMIDGENVTKLQPKKGKFDPLHPNISRCILHTVLKVLTRRICFKNLELLSSVIISFFL